MDRREFVYMGARLNGSKLSVALLPVPGEGEPMGRDLWWDSSRVVRALSRYSPGDVVSIPAEESEDSWKIVADSAQYVREWEDDQDRLEWTMTDKAARTEKKARGLKKDRDALRQALDPVREIYQRQVGANQVAMLAQIIRYLEGGN